jgi:putative membrane protein
VRLFFYLAAVLGLATSIALVGLYGFADIGRAIASAGWGLLAVVAFHLLQIAFSAEGWRTVLPPSSAPSFPTMFRLRWIREAVNALLPLAQIGGEFVGARLLVLRQVAVSAAGASVTVDLSLEMISQIIFTLFGIGLLMVRPHDARITQWILSATVAAAAVVIAFVLTQRYGLFRLIERGLVRFARLTGWSTWGQVGGLHEAIVAAYRDPRRLCLACGHHLISWLLGGVEVVLALHFLGVGVDLREGLIIESLGQASRALGFAIPGALGVQEAGYILVCGLVGVAPQAAIELSLVKRIREVLLGVPGLIAWQIVEGRRLARYIAPGGTKRSSSELTP